MLPRWIAHYAAQVGMESLVVIDDNSTDGSTDDLPCTVVRIPPLEVAGLRLQLGDELGAPAPLQGEVPDALVGRVVVAVGSQLHP